MTRLGSNGSATRWHSQLSRERRTSGACGLHRRAFAAILFVLLAGLVCFRVIDFAHRLLSPDIAAVAFAEGGDDGYYYFTVARNIATGHGITIDHIHWTSGFQPLWMAVCAAAFLVPERAALALLYIFSLACWIISAGLIVRFARNALGRPTPVLATLAISAIFMCDEQIFFQYFNGMETGLAITLTLYLLLAVQRYLQAGLQPSSLRVSLGLGIIVSLTLLARNDTVFLCVALLGLIAFAGDRRRALRDAVVIVFVATTLLLPWLFYCQWVYGVPVPQSGIATSAALRGGHPVATFTYQALLDAVTPILSAGQHNLMLAYPGLTSITVAIAAIGFVIAWSRAPRPGLGRATTLVLAALVSSCVPLVLYYSLFSGAGHFFVRYFLPLKLLILILLSLLIAHAFTQCRPRAVSRIIPAMAILCMLVGIVTADFRIWRDFGRPYLLYMGEFAHDVPRLPFWAGTRRIGMAESGRLGYLLPDRVVNLDGKMRPDALRALSTRTMADFLRDLDIDCILLANFDVYYFDHNSPGWREHFGDAKPYKHYFIFEKKRM